MHGDGDKQHITSLKSKALTNQNKDFIQNFGKTSFQNILR